MRIEEKQVCFFPIQGLVHHGNIATVTKQRAFNKAMITPFTEVILIDEADKTTLDVADWKILTQGGYTAHDVKYQTAKAFLNKCLMLVTAQRKLDFGPADQPEMDRRLRMYQFKTSRIPKEGRQLSSKSSAWNASFGLLKKQKHINIALSTDEEEDNCIEHGVSSTSIDRLNLLREAVSRSHPESVRHRQVQHMLMEEERLRAEEEKRKRQQHLRRKSMLRKNGVSTQNAELLPLDPGEEMPNPIVLDLE
ncbi:unnamed protein product, partial [Porites evermanni]